MSKENEMKIKEELEAKFSDLFGDVSDDSEIEEVDNIIILRDENGEDVEFEFLDLIEFSGDEYVVLLPVEDSDEAGEVVILKVEETESNEESYVSVEDDNVLQAVFEMFKEKFKNEFNFVD